jgi:hypothetical protein
MGGDGVIWDHLDVAHLRGARPLHTQRGGRELGWARGGMGGGLKGRDWEGVGSDCGGYHALAVELQELDRQAILRLEQLVLHELDLRTQRRKISALEWSARLKVIRNVRAE